MQRILIVTGAGASRELNAETGDSLIRRISKDMCEPQHALEPRPGSDLVNQYYSYKRALNRDIPDRVHKLDYQQNIYPFKQQLIHWADQGKIIDSFLQLETTQTFKPFGQFAIAYYMIGAEEQMMRQSLFAIKRNWLKLFLSNHLIHKIDDIRDGKLLMYIITFNYDRSIEHYTYNYLRHNETRTLLGRNELGDEAKNFIESIAIKHVYGKLANLDWQDNENALHSFQFGERNDEPKRASLVMNAIKTIGERVDNNLKNEIRNSVQSANKIYILGFGYDRDNMKTLFGEDFELLNNQKQEIIGTAYGMLDKVQELYPKVSAHNCTCHDLIENDQIFSLD